MKHFFIGIFALVLFSCPLYAQEDNKLLIFHSPSCRACIEAKNKLIPQIQKEYAGKLQIEYRDVSDIEHYKSMLKLKEAQAEVVSLELPVFYFKGRFLNHKRDVAAQIRQLMALAMWKAKPLPYQLIAKPEKIAPGERGLPEINLIARFKNFRPLAVISAGLVDGINPCAFTVIVFFISFLALQGYRKNELMIIGLTFIFAVFLTYILIGLGLFGIFYRLEGFAFLANIVNISIGIFSIVLGFFALYDFFKFKRTGLTEGLILQLPKVIKTRIHSLIGSHYRDIEAKQPGKRNILRLAFSALITGFLISVLEAVCTGQVYLPTIAFVLKATPLKLEALGYLLLYNFMFILPLLAIFLFALWGVTSAQFAHFLKRHLLTIKLLMAILFLGLGVYLVCGFAQQASPEGDTLASGQASMSGKSVPYHDFGQVRQGRVSKHNFLLKNETAKILNIRDVNTSCGCTVSKIKKKKLLPGESTFIEVKLNTKGYSGEIQQFVYLHTDNLDNPILRFIIKAEVVK